eukprot:904633-Pelagomonas_calceolata.AAC.1
MAAHRDGTEAVCTWLRKQLSHDPCAQELPGTGALKTSASSGCKIPPPHVRQYLAKVPEEISARYFGCGTPVPAGLPAGLKVRSDCSSGQVAKSEIWPQKA